MRRSPVDPTKATRRPSGVGGHTIRVGANRGRYPTATGRLESSTPATERAFLDQLSESSSPEVVKFAESVFEQAPAHDLTITWGEAGPLLRYEDETGHRFTFGKLSRRGTLGDTHLAVCTMSEARARRVYLSALPGPSRCPDSGRDPPQVPHTEGHGTGTCGDKRWPEKGWSATCHVGHTRSGMVRDHRRHCPENP